MGRWKRDGWRDSIDYDNINFNFMGKQQWISKKMKKKKMKKKNDKDKGERQ